jgi:putative transposase
MRKEYKSDLTGKEWEQIKPHIPPAKWGGRPQSTDMREVLNPSVYGVKTGCQWSMLPMIFRPK